MRMSIKYKIMLDKMKKKVAPVPKEKDLWRALLISQKKKK